MHGLKIFNGLYNRCSQLIQVVRWHHWSKNKLVNLLALWYLSFLYLDVSPHFSVVSQMLGFLISAIGFAAFGHLVNDLGDIRHDLEAGKKNSIAQLPVGTRALLLAGSLMFAWLPWLWLPVDRLIIALLLVEFILLLTYPLTPFRLKERGFAAIIADAAYAYVIPAMLILRVMNMEGAIVPAVVLWQSVTGIRNILLHQLFDLKHDRLSNVKTFVQMANPRLIRGIVLTVLPALEIASLLTVLTLALHQPLQWLVVFAFILLKITIRDHRYVGPGEDKALRISKNIINNYYDEWLAPTLLVLLSLSVNPYYLVLLAIHLTGFNRLTLVDIFHKLLPQPFISFRKK